MNIFVNDKCTKIVDTKTNSVPVSIATDIRLLHLYETGDYTNVYDDNNERLYIDIDGNQYTEEYLYTKGEYIDEYTPLDIEMYLDERIYMSESIKLEPLTKKVGVFNYTNLTEENAHLFDLDEVMNSEFANIVEDSNYEGVLYYILTELNVTNSSFKALNKLSATLGKNDYISIEIDKLTTNINTLELFNIPDSLNVYINNSKVEFGESGELILTGLNTNKISLEIRNENSYNVTVVNPYILYV